MLARREVVVRGLAAGSAVPAGGQSASTVVRGGDFLFVSGLTAVDPQSGARIRDTTANETRHILEQLKLKFGPLDETAEARVAAADDAALDRYAERVLSAATLSAVLED